MQGDLIQLTIIAKTDEKLLHNKDENGWRPLHEACRTGQKDVIDFLLQHGADINALTDRGASPLRLAKQYLRHDHPVLAYLESLGAKDIGLSVSSDPYAAHKAAMTGDLVELTTIAEMDNDLVHKKDENGWRPIHEAVRSGHQHVVEFLLERGADINERTDFGESPLHLAKSYLEPDHPIFSYLESLGAKDTEQEL